MTNINFDNKIKLLHTKTAILIKDKKSDDCIIMQLAEEGIDINYAEMIIENVKNDIYNKKQLWKHVGMGLFILTAGLIINYLSYENAVKTGATTFWILLGIPILGIIVLTKGLIIFRK